MKNQHGNILVVGIVIGLLIASGLFGAYYFGTQQSKFNIQTPQESATETAKQTSSSFPTPESTNNIPGNWTTKKSTLCNVSLPRPPKEAPYITLGSLNENMDGGAFWQFSENDKYSDDMFTYSVSVFYENPEALGSGYVAGSVQITCSQNKDGLTTDTLLAAYEKKFTDGVYQGFKIKSKKEVNKWGKRVWEIKHTGGMFDENNPTYYFATPNHIYSVNRVALSQNNFVKETTEKIFNNLQF